MYVAVVPAPKVDSSIFGTLEFAPVNSTPFNFVIYFLNAKSNVFSFGFTVNVVSSDSGVFDGIITGCSWLFFVEAHNVNFVLL